MELQMSEALSHSKQPTKLKGAETQVCHGLIALIGDCFADGRRLAFIEVRGEKQGVALAAWEQGRWQLLSIWNIQPAWIPAGKKVEDFPEYSHLRLEPSQTPYQLVDLDGDAVSELIVAFNNDGYQLGYAIIKQNRGEALPKLLDCFSCRKQPQFRAGYLLTYSDSGRKSWWGETDYYRWEKGQPIHVATWHDDAYDPDKPYWQVTRADSAPVLRIEWDQGCQITQILSAPDVAGAREVAYAKVEMDWKPGLQPDAKASDFFEAAQLYLFEKLTGIPAAAYDDTVNGKPLADVLPLLKRLKVRVKGSKEAVLRLTSPVAGQAR